MKRHAWSIAIFVAVFSFYLLTQSREPAWGDAHGMWEVAEHIVDRGGIDISTRWPEDIPPGEGGKYYGIAPIGPSLVHVPGAQLLSSTHARWPRQDALMRPIATHLAPAALGALACVVLFGLLCDLGYRKRTASLGAATLALATTTWVYARMPYSEILQLACFLGTFRAVLRCCTAPTRREGLWLGAWAGCLLNAKYVFATPIVGGALVLAWVLRSRRRELGRVLAWAAASGLPFAILALWYNDARWGDVTHTGYEPYLDAFFGGSLLDGAWGMLLSPNKSAFLFSPPLILAVIGLPAAIRANRRVGLALVAMVLPTFLVYCTYRSWSGDYAWGPRFFVWAVPPLMIGIAPVIERATTRLRKGVLALVLAAGVGVQMLGVALYWDHFIRIAIEAKNQWLGNPNRKGSYVAERGRGHCDSCFEDTYELMWTPPFNQIRGNWWLVKTLLRDDDMTAAQQDAPWRTYTTLDLRLTNYGRTRWDWWVMIWWKDAPQTETLGVVFLVLFLAGTAGGAAMWVRLHRRDVV